MSFYFLLAVDGFGLTWFGHITLLTPNLFQFQRQDIYIFFLFPSFFLHLDTVELRCSDSKSGKHVTSWESPKSFESH